uniref:NADH dehydrogenase subunit 2 n=1 Tax=Arthurdendyus triangulatus TaxID=132421 RepID=UPI002E767B48|nr:NADH dehydrogenase subunit 2 [Arthurdendyus triangulatus]WPY71420.1 NADH dehydrogenase subunit 2 [Arthurdendyus triangulatus]
MKFINVFLLNFLSVFSVLGMLFFICSTVNIISFFLLLELNGFLVVLILFLNSFYETTESVFLYFILNTLVFIMFLWGVSFESEDLILLSLFLKLGFFPFIWWFPYLSDNISYFSFFILSVVQKSFPLFLIYWNNFLDVGFSLVLVLLTVFISLINLVYNQNNIKVFLAWSSNINFSWILLILFRLWSFGFSYYFFYSIVFCVLIYVIRFESLFWDQLCISNLNVLLICLVTFCSFAGFPPFIGFYYKYVFFSMWEDIQGEFPLLLYGSIFSLFFTWNSFVYINMLFKLNINKWVFHYSFYSQHLVYLFIIYLFISLFSFYV